MAHWEREMQAKMKAQMAPMHLGVLWQRAQGADGECLQEYVIIEILFTAVVSIHSAKQHSK